MNFKCWMKPHLNVDGVSHTWTIMRTIPCASQNSYTVLTDFLFDINVTHLCLQLYSLYPRVPTRVLTHTENQTVHLQELLNTQHLSLRMKPCHPYDFRKSKQQGEHKYSHQPHRIDYRVSKENAKKCLRSVHKNRRGKWQSAMVSAACDIFRVNNTGHERFVLP